MHSPNGIADNGSLRDQDRRKFVLATAHGDRGVFQRCSSVKRNRWVQTKTCVIQFSFLRTDLVDNPYLHQEHIEDT
jgi:hypothetical protein